MWKKLAMKYSSRSTENFITLKQNGLDDHFENINDESDHFERLCKKFEHYKSFWNLKEPTESFLCCAPADVNKNFKFEWTPWWQWKNQGGWIAAFTIYEHFLLCGVIETLQVWNLKKQECVLILETPRSDIIDGVDIALNCLDLFKNIAVSGSNEGVIRVWDIKSGQYCNRLDCSEYGAVNCLKLSEHHLLSGHDDGQFIIWSVKSPQRIECLITIVEHSDIVWCLDISSSFVASCSEDKSILVYKHSDIYCNNDYSKKKCNSGLPTGLRLLGHRGAVTCISLDRNIIISGSRDKSVIVWKVENESFSMLNILHGHTELLHYVAQDQDRIFSSDDNGELLVWDKETVLKGINKQEKKSSYLVRRFDYGERGAIDCIKILGSKVFLSYDDFGKIAINDFW